MVKNYHKQFYDNKFDNLIENNYLKVQNLSWALVARTCNLSYSVGRDQEDHSSKPAPGYLKNLF
jgi:hypothetical protein